MKKTKTDREFVDSVLEDENQESWEKGLLGKDPKHAKAVDLKIEVKTLPTSIRLPINLVEALKQLSEEEGIAYQTYLKMILTRHIREKRKVG